MEHKVLEYYETIDGQKFFQRGPDGYDDRAQSKAAKHEINVLKGIIGEHKYYVVAVLRDNEVIGWIPKIRKESGITHHLKFAKRFESIGQAYTHFKENTKIVGFDD